jgi:hypothetical protein
MPLHRTDGELLEYANGTGLNPRKLYEVFEIDGDFVVFEDGKKAHYSSFKNGEIDYKLGKDDDSWHQQKARLEERHENFYKET